MFYGLTPKINTFINSFIQTENKIHTLQSRGRPNAQVKCNCRFKVIFLDNSDL